MSESKGKRAGARSGERSGPKFGVAALGSIVLATAALIGWGLLVYVAISYGEKVRNGDQSAWPMLLGAGVAAVACLFATFVLLAKLFGSVTAPPTDPANPEALPRPVGGRRAKR